MVGDDLREIAHARIDVGDRRDVRRHIAVVEAPQWAVRRKRLDLEHIEAGGAERAIQESARRIYASAGFAIVENMPERNFGKDMTGEMWEMRF